MYLFIYDSYLWSSGGPHCWVLKLARRARLGLLGGPGECARVLGRALLPPPASPKRAEASLCDVTW